MPRRAMRGGRKQHLHVWDRSRNVLGQYCKKQVPISTLESQGPTPRGDVIMRTTNQGTHQPGAPGAANSNRVANDLELIDRMQLPTDQREAHQGLVQDPTALSGRSQYPSHLARMEDGCPDSNYEQWLLDPQRGQTGLEDDGYEDVFFESESTDQRNTLRNQGSAVIDNGRVLTSREQRSLRGPRSLKPRKTRGRPIILRGASELTSLARALTQLAQQLAGLIQQQQKDLQRLPETSLFKRLPPQRLPITGQESIDDLEAILTPVLSYASQRQWSLDRFIQELMPCAEGVFLFFLQYEVAALFATPFVREAATWENRFQRAVIRRFDRQHRSYEAQLLHPMQLATETLVMTMARLKRAGNRVGFPESPIALDNLHDILADHPLLAPLIYQGHTYGKIVTEAYGLLLARFDRKTTTAPDPVMQGKAPSCKKCVMTSGTAGPGNDTTPARATAIDDFEGPVYSNTTSCDATTTVKPHPKTGAPKRQGRNTTRQPATLQPRGQAGESRQVPSSRPPQNWQDELIHLLGQSLLKTKVDIPVTTVLRILLDAPEKQGTFRKIAPSRSPSPYATEREDPQQQTW